MYYILVQNYGNPAAVLVDDWSIYTVNAFILQAFLVFRIWRFRRNKWLTGICAAFALTHFGVLLRLPIEGFIMHTPYDLEVKLKWIGTSGLSISLATNVAISAVMAFCLWQHRTGFHRSDHMIKKLIVLTLTTGALPSSFELAEIIAYDLAPTSWYDLFFSFIKSKLYVLSLLAILNMRDSIRNSSGKIITGQITSIPLTNLTLERPDKNPPTTVDPTTESGESDKTLATDILSTFGMYKIQTDGIKVPFETTAPNAGVSDLGPVRFPAMWTTVPSTACDSRDIWAFLRGARCPTHGFADAAERKLREITRWITLILWRLTVKMAWAIQRALYHLNVKSNWEGYCPPRAGFWTTAVDKLANATTSPPLLKFDVIPFIAAPYFAVAVSSLSWKRQSDRWFIQCLVVIHWTLDSTHQAFVLYSMYYVLVQNYGNPSEFLTVDWSIQATLFMNVVNAFILQSFLVYRIWRLCRNIWLTGICAALTLAHFVVSLRLPIEGFIIYSAYDLETKLKWVGTTGLSISLAANVFISSAMAFCLRQQRTGFRKSDHIITKLVILTLTTGALPSSFELAELIAYNVAPTSWYDLFFSFTKSKLYVLSLLAILNMRALISNDSNNIVPDQINSIPLTDLGIQRSDKALPAVNILVTQSVESDHNFAASKFGSLEAHV
ncbi:hypothetical protein NM688_g3685 [Phlebia brevispora]|uniref:Uncharacterized protein n=1 Tax=Phlebia brevispora TaxID=194682 RepID=A0ACC1T583_9APHY|nr:hypothetical protein NM688_g3685 [Phlebia brevispora]